MMDKGVELIQLGEEFHKDTEILSKQANSFVMNVSPYFSVDNNALNGLLDQESAELVDNFRFFRFGSCTTEDIDDLAKHLNEKMEKLFIAIHALNVPIIYGVVSYEGKASIVFGVESKDSESAIKTMIEGLLNGIELTPFKTDFLNRPSHAKMGGVISTIPVLKIGEEKQKFDISTLMRSLNGQNYTVLFIARPYEAAWIHDKYNRVLEIRDKCFAVSKRNIATQNSKTNTNATTETKSSSHTFSAIVYSYSASKNISQNISEAIGSSDTISFDKQNGLALELIQYCDKAIERFKQGQHTGIWGTSVVYSADSALSASIIKSCLCSELSKPATDILPLRDFSYELMNNQDILLPTNLLSEFEEVNPLCAPITSHELAMICTPPSDLVPNFELKKGKVYPMIPSNSDGIVVGKVSDGHRPLNNMEFSFSEMDLNKHTFICGITGSGKTTTVKGILKNSKKPFIVIEAAKKEYRNIKLDNDEKLNIFTLGKPELNCLRFNPFYIQCGVNLQTHIDFLKDLFNASFSFYGPMPYILEKCLHNIYKKKGWNMTLGYHPYLVNMDNPSKFFDLGYMKKQYNTSSHKFLFPTMQDLKSEIKRYIEQDMKYEGEVAGNIKTAIIARLESLCIGSKGFMFNTNEFIDMNSLMDQKVVFELEGLSDDSDKAFCVGLFIIFINEYRQLFKEEHNREKLGLQHLLVIEEAHRLLKNVETERTSENMGNPKGKAVEHFTNMIAEMRSYGQGVIIAEQIPSKLAPDVIKNSSNKIIHRIVSQDDQTLVSNTIGIKDEDSVYLGNQKTGIALCHKEGMSLPVKVFINDIEEDIVDDETIYKNKVPVMFEEINLNIVKESLESSIDLMCIRILNSILAEETTIISEAIKLSKDVIAKELIKKNCPLIMCRDVDYIFGKVIADGIIELLTNGVYSINNLVSDKLYNEIFDLCTKDRIDSSLVIRNLLKIEYKQDCRNRCVRIISELIKQKFTNGIDVKNSIRQYFYNVNENLLSQIETAILEVR